MTRLLMSPPADYAATTPQASRQWERLTETLECAGDVRVERVEPEAMHPELVFTANAALISGKLAIMGSRGAERRREQRPYRAALTGHGFATTFLQQAFFAGACDALFDRIRPVLYVGYGWRSERAAGTQIADVLGVRVASLMLVDERFYHLDMCLCPLASGHVLVHMPAFSPHAQNVLRRTIGPEYLIEVGTPDALDFACNAVDVGDAVVLHAASPRLRDRLHDAGYRIFATELSEFHALGGSAKRLTLKLDDGPAVSEAAA